MPENPATPRVHDDRVGFFSVSFEDYGSEAHETESVRYITRWRLEKQDPSAEVSDPVKPIVFYVGRGVPDQWRPWVHYGIEMWQAAFEKAGFSNAVVAMDPGVDPEVWLADACVSTTVGVARGGSAQDVFERVAEVSRLAGWLKKGESYGRDAVEYGHDLAEWQAAIAESREELEDDFKKAKKDRDKKKAEAEEKGKEFKEKRYKEDKRPKPPKPDPKKAVMARVANGERQG